MKNLILIFLFILSVPVLSAETAATSSSENGFIITSNQISKFVCISKKIARSKKLQKRK